MLSSPPLSLYIHLPWCIRKCPYCDFNSHELKNDLPHGDYIDALIADLEQELPRVWGRTITSIFIGGGTPSLFPASDIGRLLDAVRARISVRPDAEVTLEANPGTIERDQFEAYSEAGVNRISLGVQSFSDNSLKALGRIHGAAEARQALAQLRTSGIGQFNIDLMVGLPGQTEAAALADIEEALHFKPNHISHYQLTLEPNTLFAVKPPVLPESDTIDEMITKCHTRLVEAGYRQYETSAWSLPGAHCDHNLNYWRYGDYLGIGAGAHGKITLAGEGRIIRTIKQKQPRRYLESAGTKEGLLEQKDVAETDRIFEYFLNRVRLHDAIPLNEFECRTGLSRRVLSTPLARAESKELLLCGVDNLEITPLGHRFQNDLQAIFLLSD